MKFAQIVFLAGVAAAKPSIQDLIAKRTNLLANINQIDSQLTFLEVTDT
jgi:hypothetical protein